MEQIMCEHPVCHTMAHIMHLYDTLLGRLNFAGLRHRQPWTYV